MAATEQAGDESEANHAPPPHPRARAKGEVAGRELSRLQVSAARRVAEAKAIVPHAYLSSAVPLAPGVAELGAGELISCCGRALDAHRALNSSYRDGAIETYSRVNIAITVPADEGELAPTIFDADRRPAAEIDAELSDLRAGAAAGSLTSPDLAGATFTLTLLDGAAGTLLGAVTPGQAAHLGIGRAREVALARDGALVTGRQVEVGLAFDARAVPPRQAASFMRTLAELVGSASEPES